MGEPKAAKNTDTEIWRRVPDDYYSPSIHVTKNGGVGINVGGLVYVRPVEEWHGMVATITADRKRFEEILNGYTKDWAEQKRGFQKRIEELEEKTAMYCPDCKIVYPLSAIPKKPSGILCEKCKGVLRHYLEWRLSNANATIADQTAEIERLRGQLERIENNEHEDCDADYGGCTRAMRIARQALDTKED